MAVTFRPKVLRSRPVEEAKKEKEKGRVRSEG